MTQRLTAGVIFGSLGLKFGVYTSAGNFTCHAKKDSCNDTCNVGSLGHYTDDAATFAGWGLDFVKMGLFLSCSTLLDSASPAPQSMESRFLVRRLRDDGSLKCGLPFESAAYPSMCALSHICDT